MIPLICIEGPTASGKTALALALAEQLSTEIVSADSRQVYKYLDIGTAKATPEERSRVKHHLIDFLEPDQSYNAGSFAKDASRIIAQIHERGSIPIICGGTGLYIRALLEGLCELPEVDQSIRNELGTRLKVLGSPALHAELQACDPLLASKISPADPQRILRALEVFRQTGKALSRHWEEQNREQVYQPYRILVDPPRKILYERINNRFDQMISAGLLNEISSVLSRGFSLEAPGLNTLGYKEFIPYLSGEESLEQCSLMAKQHSRNYAKRQATWYRKNQFDLTITQTDLSIYDILPITDEIKTKIVQI